MPEKLPEDEMTDTNNTLLLTSSKVADLLGVHPSTVKRWCDDGTLESRRTGGGHRRIRLNDALDTARVQGITTFLEKRWRSVWIGSEMSNAPSSFASPASRQGSSPPCTNRYMRVATLDLQTKAPGHSTSQASS